MIKKLVSLVSCGLLALVMAAAVPVSAADSKSPVALFKVISENSEVLIGLNETELRLLGGSDAGTVAQALKEKGPLNVWQYAVKKAANGDLQEAPYQKIALTDKGVVRVEPYKSPLAVLPHD